MTLLEKLRAVFLEADKLPNFDFGIMTAGWDESGKALIDAEGELVCECANAETAKMLVELLDAAYNIGGFYRLTDDVNSEATR